MSGRPRVTAASRIKEVSAKREHSFGFMSGALVAPASREQRDHAVGDRRDLRVAPAISRQREPGRVWNEVRPHAAIGHDPTRHGRHRVVERRAHKLSERPTPGSPILPAIAPNTLPEIHALEVFRLRYRGSVIVLVDDGVSIARVLVCKPMNGTSMVASMYRV